jgi:hypothetical protein
VLVVIDECSEQLIIGSDKPYVTLQGSGMYNTKISWKEDLAQSGSDFTDAAAQIKADHFTAMDISFEVNFLSLLHPRISLSEKQCNYSKFIDQVTRF